MKRKPYKLLLPTLIVLGVCLFVLQGCNKEGKENADSGTITDTRDGQTYNWVKIGNQVWMAENLRYLPSVVGPRTGSQTTSYYYVYDYDKTNVADAKATANYITYGVLYNWESAKNACPSGWHLPSDAEWEELENYLADNGYNHDGTTGGGGDKIAKSLGSTSGWTGSTSIGAVGNADYPEYRNKSGFTALPGGARGVYGTFNDLGGSSNWWIATEASTDRAWNTNMLYNGRNIYRGTYHKENGFSVRCVRDVD